MSQSGTQTADTGFPLYGDVLVSVISRVPLIDLVSTSYVCNSWNRTVLTSLRHFNPTKPWLIVHSQSTKHPYHTTSHAYDPRSNLWVEIKRPEINHAAALRSSNSCFVYMLSPSRFCFSFDPLHLTWHSLEAPIVWRTDPIVAMIGRRVVIAGGTCEFEDDPLAVEMYDVDTRMWQTCQSMPSIFEESAASTSLSVATSNDEMYVMERISGITYSFNVAAKKWKGPYDLSLNYQDARRFLIGLENDRLILVSVELKSVKIWEVERERMEIEREIGEMPKEYVEKLRIMNDTMPCLTVNGMGGFVFISNASVNGEVVMCEVDGGGACEWRSVRNPVVDERRTERDSRLVFCCGKVGLGDLETAIVNGGVKFAAC